MLQHNQLNKGVDAAILCWDATFVATASRTDGGTIASGVVTCGASAVTCAVR